MANKEAFTAHFTEQGLKYNEVEPGVFRVAWTADPYNYVDLISVDELGDGLGERIMITASPDVEVPLVKRDRVLDLLNRRNLGIVFGKWVIDRGGRLYFQMSTLAPWQLPPESINVLMSLTAAEVTALMTAAIGVIEGGQSVDEVMAALERGAEPGTDRPAPNGEGPA